MVLVTHAVRTIPRTLGVGHQTKQLGVIPFYKPKNNKTMKRKFVFFWAAMAAMCVGCSSESDEWRVSEPTDVVLTFSPYDVSQMTRTAVSIADVVTHLNVWLVNGDDVIALQQTNSDAGFGTITATLDRTKTYTLYAVGHKADGATLSDGVISFTDDKTTHSMFYTTTFSPANTTNLSCLMQRIVADFRMEIIDDIPAECKSLRFTISDVFDRWNVTTGGTHSLNRVSTINCNGTSSIFNVYAIVTDASTTHDIMVEALDANGDVLQSRTFADVPLRNGYKTNYRGTFFIDTPMIMSFTVDDWNEYDVVDF